MLEDVNYSFLKEKYPVKYEIMLLRDLYGNTFGAIAKEFKISTARVTQNYHFIKIRQAQLYVRHLSVVHGYGNMAFFRNLLMQVYECYQDWQSTITYFEKEYQDILENYRCGEPSMPKSSLAKLPPFIKTRNNQTYMKIVQLKEVQKKSFIAIGNALKMTTAKAKTMYSEHYHAKSLALVEKMKPKLGESKADALFCDYYMKYRQSKKYYDALCRDFEEFSQIPNDDMGDVSSAQL